MGKPQLGNIIENAYRMNTGGQDLGSPAAAGAASVLAAQALPAAGTTTVNAGITNPDVPRNVSITGNQAGINGTVVVNGTDAEDKAITENIVANGAATVVGNKAFKTVTSIVFPTRNGAGDTISVGRGSKLGLGARLKRDTLREAYLNGVREAVRPTVAFDQTNLSGNTVQLASALNGTSVVVDYSPT